MGVLSSQTPCRLVPGLLDRHRLASPNSAMKSSGLSSVSRFGIEGCGPRGDVDAVVRALPAPRRLFSSGSVTPFDFKKSTNKLYVAALSRHSLERSGVSS